MAGAAILAAALLLLTVGCTGATPGDVSQVRGAVPTTIHLLSTGAVDPEPAPFPQVEPHVVVDPRDPARLTAAAMSVSEGAWEVRVWGSQDGGRNWRRHPLPMPAKTWKTFDPWLAWAPDGSALYLVVVEIRREAGGGERWRLPVFRSLDRGETWARWGEVPGRTLDRPVLLTAPKAVFVVASEAVADATVVIARAPVANHGDLGNEAADLSGRFTHRQRYTPPNSQYILGAAALLQEDRLVLMIADRSGLRDQRPRPLYALTYDDEMARFGEAQRVGEAHFVGAPTLAFDSSPASPHQGRLYAAWAGRDASGGGTLEIAASEDGGDTWSAARAVRPVKGYAEGTSHEDDAAPDDKTAQGTAPLAADSAGLRSVPVATVDPQGRLGLLWRQHEVTGPPQALATACSALHFAVSLDGGTSFPLHRRLTAEPSCPDQPANRLSLGGIPFLQRWPGGGDYAGLAVGSDGIFHPLWAHSQDGPYRIRAAALRLGSP